MSSSGHRKVVQLNRSCGGDITILNGHCPHRWSIHDGIGMIVLMSMNIVEVTTKGMEDLHSGGAVVDEQWGLKGHMSLAYFQWI